MAPSASEPHRIGRYAVFDVIGAGGTADVHLGCKTGRGAFVRMVAVKRLRSDRLNETEFVSMLIDEARLTSRIVHANTVPVIDVVRTSSELLLVSDYVHGETLATLLREQGSRNERTPPGIAAAIAIGVLNGLQAAHTATDTKGEPLAIIHRDVSPQNVMIAIDGLPRILDFGMAKARGRLTATADGIIKGKLAYMAPEQLQGKAIAKSVDIWAVGVVLWEMLAGKRLFAGEEADMLEQILLADVPLPSRWAKGLSPELDEVVLRALSHDPAKRFGSAEEMAKAIAEAQPPAYGSVVGAWVERLAGERLGKRADVLARCERAAAGLGDVKASANAHAKANANAHAKTDTVSLLMVGAVVVAMVVMIAIVVIGKMMRVPVDVAAAPAVVESAAPVDAVPMADPLPSASALASAVPAYKPRPNPCAVPYTLDAQQRKIYKRECLK